MTKRTPGLEGTVQNTVQAGETDEMDEVGAAREDGAAPVAVREAAGTLFHAIGGAVTDATERAKVSLGETVKATGEDAMDAALRLEHRAGQAAGKIRQ